MTSVFTTVRHENLSKLLRVTNDAFKTNDFIEISWEILRVVNFFSMKFNKTRGKKIDSSFVLKSGGQKISHSSNFLHKVNKNLQLSQIFMRRSHKSDGWFVWSHKPWTALRRNNFIAGLMTKLSFYLSRRLKGGPRSVNMWKPILTLNSNYPRKHIKIKEHQNL